MLMNFLSLFFLYILLLRSKFYRKQAGEREGREKKTWGKKGKLSFFIMSAGKSFFPFQLSFISQFEKIFFKLILCSRVFLLAIVSQTGGEYEEEAQSLIASGVFILRHKNS